MTPDNFWHLWVITWFIILTAALGISLTAWLHAINRAIPTPWRNPKPPGAGTEPR